MKLSKREILLCCLLGFMFLIYLYNRFCLLPLEGKLERLKDENLALQLSIQRDEKSVRNHEVFAGGYSSALGKSRELEIAIPPNPCLPELLNYLDNSAGKNGVKLVTLRHSQPQTAGREGKGGQSTADELQKMELGISVKGTYPRLLGFISAIEESPRILHIEHCKMSNDRGTTIEDDITQMEIQEKNPCRQEIEGSEIPLAPPEPVLQKSEKHETEEITLSLTLVAYFERNLSPLPQVGGIREDAETEPQERRNPFF